MTIPKIAELPVPPNRQQNSPVVFSERGDAFLGALPGFRNQANALADFMESRIAAAVSSASAAANSAAAAQSSANSVGNAASTAQSAANAASSSATAAASSASTASSKATAAAQSATTATQQADRAQLHADYVSGVAGGAAPLNSPNFTGSPKAPTPGSSDNSTRLANTAWVRTFVGTAAVTPMDFEKALKNSGNYPTASASYTYNAAGQVTKITTPAGNTTMTYNADGTVKTVTYPTGRKETYTYSAAGQVASMTATGG